MRVNKSFKLIEIYGLSLSKLFTVGRGLDNVENGVEMRWSWAHEYYIVYRIREVAASMDQQNKEEE